jgi:hypothetical protein
MSICPGHASTNIFSILSLPLPTAASEATQIPATVNATAVLPNGSTTVFSSSVMPAPDSSLERVGPADAARIVIDGNGCQTLFVPKTTAVCSTRLRLVGLPDVVVSRCDQWVTFSSDTKLCPNKPVPTETMSPVESVGCPDETVMVDLPPPSPIPDESFPTPVMPQATGEASSSNDGPIRPTGFDSSYTETQPGPTPTIFTLTQSSIFASNPFLSLPASSPSPVIDQPSQSLDNGPYNQTAQLNNRQITEYLAFSSGLDDHPSAPGTWYAAPWYSIAQGGVPSKVRAIECGDTTAKCTTFNERWTVTTVARTTTETVPVTYSGVCSPLSIFTF